MKFLSKLLGDLKPESPTAPEVAADRIARALSAAGLDRQGHGSSIRHTIDQALASAGLNTQRDVSGPQVQSRTKPAAVKPASKAPPTPAARGNFRHATFANEHGRRDYRLYVPQNHDATDAPRPLILMLHGCTQSVEDFAVGTRMNLLADQHGFLVAYPQQFSSANQSKCWNWFRPEDQGPEAGEPAILAGLVREIAQEYRVDTDKVFVAGLSAGAAMAVILGRTHPTVFRAIGVHSGLPYASARDVSSAFAAMQGHGASPPAHAADNESALPLIIFHGDQDRTVAPRNADTLTAQATRPGLTTLAETGRAPGGQSYTRRISVDPNGRPWLESWTLHGAGHAWSGGDRAGSYTDPSGPDASAAMVDFFLRQG